MKRNKLFSLLLAFVLFTNLALPAFAADSDESNEDEDVIVITTTDEKEIRELLKGFDFTESQIQIIIDTLGPASPDNPVTLRSDKKLTDLPEDYNTTEDAEKVSDTNLKTDWAELDWTNANDGYVRVKWTKKIVTHAAGYVYWVEDGELKQNMYPINSDNQFDKWLNIPLTAGNTTYAVSIDMLYSDSDLSEDKSDEELDAIWRDPLRVRFKPEMKDINAWQLLSTIHADFENSPEACKKAKELVKNCKTDAEKIAAISKYVAKTIKYDKTILDKEEKQFKKGESKTLVICERDLNPDNILKSKKGICEHYAVLTAAMLRSVGVPCKIVKGTLRTSKNKTEGHVWVTVKPDTGVLSVKALAAGTDANDGWIRIDPTNMIKAPKTTADDSRYMSTQYD